MPKKLIDIFKESTVDQLYRSTVAGFPNTKQRQNVINRVSAPGIQFTPYIDSKTLLVRSRTMSNGHRYSTSVLFKDVNYQEEDNPQNASFTATDGKEYHIEPITTGMSDVQVRCTCLDFYFRFATQDYEDGSLFGKAPMPYRRKTTTRPPANPNNVPGMCKHVIKLSEELKRIGILK